MKRYERYDGSEADVVGASLYASFPALLYRTSEVFSRLFSIGRTYTLAQKYDITQRTFGSIAQLTIEYLRLRRDNLQMPTATQAMLFGAAQVTVDAVLTKQLEEFLAIYKLAASRNDEEICRQVIECHRSIALASVGIDPLYIHPGENPTLTYVSGFLDTLTAHAGARGLDDACLVGCRALSDVAVAAVSRNFYLNFISSVDAMIKVASLGIVRSKHVLTHQAVSAICTMTASSLSNSFMVANTYRHSIEGLEQISTTQLPALGSARGIDFDVQNTIGPFLEVTSSVGLAHWFEFIANRVFQLLGKDDKGIEDSMGVLRAISEQLWLHLARIGEAAAPMESFALYFVDVNVREICKMLILVYDAVRKELDTRPEPEDRESASTVHHFRYFNEELLRDIDWLISAVFWRIYDKLPSPVRSNLVWNFFDTLQELGIAAMESELDEQSIRAIEHLRSLVEAMLEKPMEGSRSPGRAAAHIARIGMVALARKDEFVVASSFNALRTLNNKFQKKFADDAELATSLLSAVDEIVEDLDRGAPPLDEVAIHFSRSVTGDSIAEYVKRLHEMLGVQS